MEVTLHNFDEAAGIFESILPNADFMSIDGEFTGIRGKPQSFTDSPEERFQSMRKIVVTYKMIQVGVCLFIRNQDQLQCFPFNFYVFPPSTSKARITMETEAVQFLVKHNMDFNKWIYEGVAYINQEQEEYEQQKSQVNPTEEPLSLNQDQQQLANQILSDLAQWKDTDEPFHDIKELNAYFRRYIYDQLTVLYPSFPVETITESFKTTIRVHRALDSEHFQQITDQIALKRETNYRNMLGFRRVFKAIAEAKIPLVLHSGSFDLMFLYQSFHAELPDSLIDYKSVIHDLFPFIFDTGYITDKIPGLREKIESSNIQGYGLGSYYQFFTKKHNPMVLPEGFERYSSSSYAHEAGYDALMTGILFFQLEKSHPEISALSNSILLHKSFFALSFDSNDILEEDGYYYFSGTNVDKLFGNKSGRIRKISNQICFIQFNDKRIYTKMRDLSSKKGWKLWPCRKYFQKKESQ